MRTIRFEHAEEIRLICLTGIQTHVQILLIETYLNLIHTLPKPHNLIILSLMNFVYLFLPLNLYLRQLFLKFFNGWLENWFFIPQIQNSLFKYSHLLPQQL